MNKITRRSASIFFVFNSILGSVVDGEYVDDVVSIAAIIAA